MGGFETSSPSTKKVHVTTSFFTKGSFTSYVFNAKDSISLEN